MTKEQIESRLNELRQEKERTALMIHVIDGAIQDCEYWLKKLEEPKKD